MRWLRPEYQTKTKQERNQQSALELVGPKKRGEQDAEPTQAASIPPSNSPWPTEPLEQVQSVRDAIDVLRKSNLPITTDRVNARFCRAPRKRIREILGALKTLGLDIAS